MKLTIKTLAIVVALALPSIASAEVTANGTGTPCGLPCTSSIDFPVSGTITDAAFIASASSGLPIALTLAGPGISTPVVVGPIHGTFNIAVTDLAPSTCATVCGSGCPGGTPTPCRPDSGTLAQTAGQVSDASQWSLNLGTVTRGGAQLDAWSLTLDGAPPLPVELVTFEVE